MELAVDVVEDVSITVVIEKGIAVCWDARRWLRWREWKLWLRCSGCGGMIIVQGGVGMD